MILGKTYSPELFLVILLVQRLSWLLSNELQYTVQCTLYSRVECGNFF